MPALKLFHFPGACSRVSLAALEQAGCPYSDELVDLMAGEHTRPGYRATNSRGKVPALLVDGQLLTENAAILCWIDRTYPEAGLLPVADGPWQTAQQLSDLFWISSVWHPYVRANRMPMRWTTGDTTPVRERGAQLLAPCVAQLDQQLAVSEWWYAAWSILDVYFYWCYTTAEEGGFDLSPYPNVSRHRAQIETWPAFQRALARENAARQRHRPKNG